MITVHCELRCWNLMQKSFIMQLNELKRNLVPNYIYFAKVYVTCGVVKIEKP